MIPIIKNNSFVEAHYLAIRDFILNQINRVLKDGGIFKNPKGQPRILLNYSNNLETQLNDFVNEPDLYLKPLIKQECSDLLNKATNLVNTNSPLIDSSTNDYKIIYNIFVSHGYEKELDKWEFINRIKIDTCTYCNRNYIYTTTKTKKIKPEIDHFYPKAKYPLLALSYYNLIPSCKPCNGFGAKEEKDPLEDGLINPYLLKNDDFIFTHIIKNISVINPLSNKSDVQIHFKKFHQGHLDVFNLNDLYELHHDHALELIIKNKIKYSKKYKAYLRSYKGLKFSKSEIDRMILGNYTLDSEQHKRPLSKLYQDIGKELKLI
ncbi:HNH endonuclease [Chryseobacterium sp. ERMR1:04]|uniref:HNH endonuclease n=1 Tax=Chryseobacterium sp. ERMR1:04 TaxID=1705393 RepID=UPI0006C8933E|nr:hypothetical protein [Chryseobacterium sp. ERMR1:04]